MATRLTLMCSGATASSRTAAFPYPVEPLDAGGRAKVLALGVRADLVFVSPWAAALETAALAGLAAEAEPLLADVDRGEWTGRSLAEIEAAEGAALAAWFADPVAATPGGESMTDLVARIAPWLKRVAAGNGAVFAITHPAVIRSTIAHALEIPAASTLNIDIAPLSLAVLSFNRCWRLQSIGK